MSLPDLQNWLVNEGINADLIKLIKMTAAAELDNVNTEFDIAAETNNVDWQQLLLASSILARSEKRDQQEAALRIATAAMTLETPPQIRDAAAVVFEKLSNRRAVQLAEQRGYLEPNLEDRLGVSMRLEASRRDATQAILVQSAGEWLPVNDFQSEFWEKAGQKGSWLSASAPTASGKTFLVLQWVVDQMRVGLAQITIYLAPTRALVTEIEDSLREILSQSDNIEITSLPLADKYTAAIKEGRKLIFVFTQERLHLLANMLENKLTLDLLVVDEAHKIGDHQRGVILQDAIERVSRNNLELKIVFVSPATQNPGELLDDAPANITPLSVDSDKPMVLQNIIVAEQVPRKPKEWNLTLRTGHKEHDIGRLQLGSSPAGLRKRLAFIAAAAGQRGGTLVYTNGAAEAEQVAMLVKQVLPKESEIDPELAALADLARKGVHRKYQLAPLVESGVAFHYGNMPSLIRMEIERLFRMGKIRFLVCTSTLIEGVNLSCRTIVLRGPRKGRGKPMEPHDFWNLAGRAGRWGNEFQGNILCIDPIDKTAWPSGVPARARYPIKRETDSVLDDAKDMVDYLERRKNNLIQDLEGSDKFEQVSAYLLSTYLRLGSVSEAAFAKRHNATEIEKFDQILSELASTIDLSVDIVVRHPGISAVSLQALMNTFRRYEGDVENLLPAPADSIDSYDRFVTIMRRINANLFPAFQPDGLVPLHSLIVLEWLKGFSLSSIIKKRIEYQENSNKTYKLPVLIRETMEIVEQTARFKAPKYISAYVDILKIFLKEVEREDLIDDGIDIGVALEFGVSSLTLLSLMELGLSRMSAVAMYEKIARDDLDKNGCIAWFQEYNSQLEGLEIPTIIVTEIRQKIEKLQIET
ncbi:DEAD/DEAH box helicase [Sphingorhabdus sp. M41]|uniref:DEAD/DEAH box helicase n=1 Tax=Sphingorhabdus sp. M41 TaxID=1806885 RepID=UPI00078D4132|nr:DEAD/DEAH box helicase [Sphingorhabdus sp. M41]AMO72507.1 DEAD/DEAH box helicase [Sphingorhabdus sp. M41]